MRDETSGISSLNRNIHRFETGEEVDPGLTVVDLVSGGMLCGAHRPIDCTSLCGLEFCDTHSCTCHGGATEG